MNRLVRYLTTIAEKKSNGHQYNYSDIIMGAMASQITASRLFTQPFIQVNIKENIKAPRHRSLCGEFTDDWWIPPQTTSNTENVSILWRHHDDYPGILPPLSSKSPQLIQPKNKFKSMPSTQRSAPWEKSPKCGLRAKICGPILDNLIGIAFFLFVNNIVRKYSTVL